MKKKIIFGADTGSTIEAGMAHWGIPKEELAILAFSENIFLRDKQHAGNVVLIREAGERRLTQLLRLFFLFNAFESSIYVWLPARGFLVNTVALIFTMYLSGLKLSIFYSNRVISLPAFLTLKKMNSISIREALVILLASFLSCLMLMIRITAVFALQLWRELNFWFVSPLRVTDSEALQQRFSRFASRYFRIEDRMFSASKNKKTAGHIELAVWTIFIVVMLIVIYPWLLAARFLKKRPLRKTVLLVSHESRINGAPRSLLTILEGIDRSEFEPILLAPGEGLLTGEARRMGITTIILPVSQFLIQTPDLYSEVIYFARLVLCLPYLLYLIACLRIKIVHTNVIVTPDAAIAAKLMFVTSLWHFREFIDVSRWSSIQTGVLNLFSDRIFCNSFYSRDLLRGREISSRKMVVVHNALDIEKFSSGQNGLKFRLSLNISPDDILIGCVGQITPVKGQETFVRAGIELARRNKRVMFALIGTLDNTPFIDTLRGLIAEAGLSDRFYFCGYRTDIPEVMLGLDIHVTPSHWAEPFGRVALEAMAVGAVSVVSGVGGLPEIVEHGVSGLIVRPGDVGDLISALEGLLLDDDCRRAISEAGIRRARSHFTSMKHIDTIQQVYRYPGLLDSNAAQSAFWSKVRVYLPSRMQGHPKMLLFYPVFLFSVVTLWCITLPLFFALLPFAMAVGSIFRRMASKSRIAVLAYQGIRNASTRYRITKVFGRFPADTYEVKIFYPSSELIADCVYVSMFYGHQPHYKDSYYYVVVYLNRLASVLRSYFYHYVVIQYELFFEGPFWLEGLVATTHPCSFYDYDDSLFAFGRYRKYLPGFLKRVGHVVVGNDFLYDYTIQFNKHVSVIPTCPDHSIFQCNQNGNNDGSFGKRVVIGWTGNPANLAYISSLTNALRRLGSEYDICFLIISAGPYDLDTLGLGDIPVQRKEWSLQKEGRDICSFDIGVMPVADDEVGRGKCGFKALQYMAAGIPCVISPVGINEKIVDNGRTGFIAYSDSEWYDYLKKLIESPVLRNQMGENARRFTLENYHIQQCKDKWKYLLRTSGSI